MAFLRKNFASGTLASSINNLAVQLTLSAGHTLPTIAGSMRLVIWDNITYPDPAIALTAGDLEIVTGVYSGTPNIYNITRAQESTGAVAHSSGHKVALHYTAGMSEDDLTDAVITHETAFVHTNIALNTTHKGLTAGNPHNVTVGDIEASPTSHRHDAETLEHDGVDSDGGAFAFDTTGLVTFNQSIVSANFEAANKLTAAATNAGEIDFTAESKKLDIEDSAIVSQDYSSDASPEFADLTLSDWQTGTPTYTSINDWMNVTQSAGLLSIEGSGIIVNAGETNKVDVAAGTGFVKTATSDLGATVFVDWDAASAIELTDNAVNKIYINYNTGTGAVTVAATAGAVNHQTQFVIGKVYSDSGTLHVVNGGTQVYNLAKRVHRRTRELREWERASGLVLSEPGTPSLKIAVSSGIVYAGLNRQTLDGADTNDGDKFTYFYRESGGWTQVADQTVIDNTNYDDGDGLSALANNTKYSLHWVYIDHDNHLFVQYGQGDYKLAEAQQALVPDAPSFLDDFAILVGRIIVKKDGTSFTSIDSAFRTIFMPSTAVNHSDLGNLDFASAGHTGFQAQGDVLDDLNILGVNAADSEFLVGTGAEALAWESGDTVRASLGLTIGTNIQAWDAGLDSLAALGYASDSFIKVTAENTYAIRTIAETKEDLSLNLVENTTLSTWAGTGSITTLGTIASGTWASTDVGIAYGGTGQSTAQAAIDALSAVGAATNEYVLTKDTGTGNAKWKAATGGSDSEKVKVDVGATADYLGAASNDGSLRTGTGLSYTDGGNFVTLDLDINALTADASPVGSTDYVATYDATAGIEKKVLLNNFHRRVDRGDPATTDWNATTLTVVDGTWTELDCSAIVPVGAVAIDFYLYIADDQVGTSLNIRKKGNSNPYNVLNTLTQVVGAYMFAHGTVACDGDRKCEYAINRAVTDLGVVITGWHMG